MRYGLGVPGCEVLKGHLSSTWVWHCLFRFTSRSTWMIVAPFFQFKCLPRCPLVPSELDERVWSCKHREAGAVSNEDGSYGCR